MEPQSALCWKSEQARQSLWLYGADKVTPAIKSLRFHPNVHVRRSRRCKTGAETTREIMKCAFVLCVRADDTGEGPARSPHGRVFGFFQFRVNLQVWAAEWFVSIDEDNYKE